MPFSGTDSGGNTHSLLRLRKIRLDGETLRALLSCKERRPLNLDMQTVGTSLLSSPTGVKGQGQTWMGLLQKKSCNNLRSRGPMENSTVHTSSGVLGSSENEE